MAIKSKNALIRIFANVYESGGIEPNLKIGETFCKSPMTTKDIKAVKQELPEYFL